MHEIEAWFDGSLNRVGGSIGYSYIIKENGITIKEHTFVSNSDSETNSPDLAEFLGLSALLDYMLLNGMELKNAIIYGDSAVVISIANRKSLNRSQRNYFHVARDCVEKMQRFTNLRLVWIPRHENKECDKISRKKQKQ